jgi:hypothetical protein
MPAKGANGVGRFSVEFGVANYADLIRAQDGTLPPDQVRRETIQGVVDSEATRLVLPQAVVKRLGLPPGNPILVRYADGRRPSARGRKGSTSKFWVATARSPPSSSRDGRPLSSARSSSRISIWSWTARLSGSCPAIPAA